MYTFVIHLLGLKNHVCIIQAEPAATHVGYCEVCASFRSHHSSHDAAPELAESHGLVNVKMFHLALCESSITGSLKEETRSA